MLHYFPGATQGVLVPSGVQRYACDMAGHWCEDAET